jgi:hypothetical protein
MAVSLCLFAALFVLLPDNPDLYLLEYRNKINLLEKPYSGTRIIFAGGSGLAFGIDSKMIGEAVGVDTVINYGLNIGIGLKYILDDISLYIKPGDILVVSVDMRKFAGRAASGTPLELARIIQIGGFKKMGLLNMEQAGIVLAGLPQIIKEKLEYFLYHIIFHKPTSNIYSLAAFNEYGDLAAHWNISDEYDIRDSVYNDWEFNNEFGMYFVNKIHEFESVCNKVIVVPEPVTKTGFDNYRSGDFMEKLASFLSENNIPFQIPPQTCVVPDSYALENYRHMNRKGVDFYSALIIDVLKDALKQPH